MRSHLTDIAVRALKPSERQYKVWDAAFPGFGVRVNGNSKSWIVMFGTKRQLKVLGRYPEISLKDARLAASKYLVQQTEPAPEVRKTATVQDAFDRYASAYCDRNQRPSTAKETKRLLQKHLLPKHGGKPIAEITKAQISKVLDELLPTPSAANHAFAAIRGFFRWAVRRDYLDSSPCDRLQRPTTPVARDRVLTEAELALVFAQACRTPHPFGHILQLLILTGQRRGEIAALRWEWIDEREKTITFPAALTKNGREHVIPYGNAVASLLETVPRGSEYLFPAARDRRKDKPATTFNGWAKPKAAFDKALRTGGSPVAPWTLHDLRRTASTMWAKLKIPQHVNDRLLNHVSGNISGVAAVYNRYEYFEEMREAVEKWDRKLATLVEATPPAFAGRVSSSMRSDLN